jgi:hypothetical protein
VRACGVTGDTGRWQVAQDVLLASHRQFGHGMLRWDGVLQEERAGCMPAACPEVTPLQTIMTH